MGSIQKFQDKADLKLALAKFQGQMMEVASRDMPPTKTAQQLMMAVSKNPAILDTSKASIMRCAFVASFLGLDISGITGEAHLIPRGGECNLQLGYPGSLKLARRSGEVMSVEAEVVLDGEEFEDVRGLDPVFRHIPDHRLNRSDAKLVVAAYAIIRMRNGYSQIAVMTREQIEGIKRLSRAKSGPWYDHWCEMAKKTVLNRALKLSPMSLEAREAVMADDRGELESLPIPMAPQIEAANEPSTSIGLDDFTDAGEQIEAESPDEPAKAEDTGEMTRAEKLDAIAQERHGKPFANLAHADKVSVEAAVK